MTDGSFVHWNGELVTALEARVSVFDAGFLYGDGIYETMRAYGGRVFALPRHLARLSRSAERIRLRTPPADELRRAVGEVVNANGVQEAIVRITVTRGALGRRLDLSSSGEPSVLVTTDPMDPGADEKRRQGVRVVYSEYVRLSEYPLAGVKSTNYQVSLFARNEAREAGALEVLVPNESGEIVEAAAANVFLVEKGGLVTPPLRSGILGGITREVVIELARANGRDVAEATLPRERIERADELFLSGTTIQVAPVVSVEDRPIADGRPGPVTIELLDGYLAAVKEDVGTADPLPPAETHRG
jgi:branched-chain amino acid aminotransferase